MGIAKRMKNANTIHLGKRKGYSDHDNIQKSAEDLSKARQLPESFPHRGDDLREGEELLQSFIDILRGPEIGT